MNLAFLDKYHRKKELRRLEKIKDAYLKEYTELCEKYKAQIMPIFNSIGGDKFQLTQQLDVYIPVTKEMKQGIIDKIAEGQTKKK